MSETPDQPRPPEEGAGDQPPMAPLPQLPDESPTQQALGDLPPLDDDLADGAEGAGRRRRFGGRWVVAAGAAAVVLLVGGIAFARSGGDDGDGDGDGVASVDGTEGDQAQGDDSDGGGSGPVDQSEFEDAMLEYAECMRDHGIDMPDPEFSGDGGGGGMVIQGGGPDGPGSAAPDSDEFEAADEACGEIMEDVRGEMPELSPEEIAEMQDKLVAMAECMRGKGYDMPDPQVDGDGRVQIEMRAGAEGTDGPPSEQMQQDQEECNEEAGMENGPLGGRRGTAADDDGSTT